MGEIQNKKGGVFDFSNKWDILYRFSLFNVDNRITRKTLVRQALLSYWLASQVPLWQAYGLTEPKLSSKTAIQNSGQKIKWLHLKRYNICSMHAFVYFNLIFYESLTDKTRTRHINVSLICISIEQYVFYFVDKQVAFMSLQMNYPVPVLL